jgi:hypothetical protein
VPTLSEFFGIIIRMYYDDHAPPHFHAYYGEFSAQIAIDTLGVMGGSLPGRALALVVEWVSRTARSFAVIGISLPSTSHSFLLSRWSKQCV